MPRLELVAGHMAANMANNVQQALTTCLNAKLCYCTQVEPCITLILTEIKGINDIIMLLVVGVT